MRTCCRSRRSVVGFAIMGIFSSIRLPSAVQYFAQPGLLVHEVDAHWPRVAVALVVLWAPDGVAGVPGAEPSRWAGRAGDVESVEGGVVEVGVGVTGG